MSVEHMCLLKKHTGALVDIVCNAYVLLLQLRDFHKELLLKIYPIPPLPRPHQGQVTFETV